MLTRSLVLVLGLAVVGCSGGKYYQSWPMESQIDGDKYHYHNAVQLNLPATMFHATQSENWMEWCKTKIEDPQTEVEHLYPFRDCRRDDKYQLTTMGSVATQFVTPVVTTTVFTAGMAYGFHSVGRGLGKSGDTVTQQGGGADSSSSSNAASKSGSDNSTVTNIGKKTTNINSGNKIITK